LEALLSNLTKIIVLKDYNKAGRAITLINQLFDDNPDFQNIFRLSKTVLKQLALDKYLEPGKYQSAA